MQSELCKVLKMLNRLDTGIENSLLVTTTPASPPRLEPVPQNKVPAAQHMETTPQNEKPAPPQAEPTPQHEEPAQPKTEATDQLIVVSPPNRNHKNRRRERRAALNRSTKAQRSPEQKVAAAEAFLANITNQAAA